MEVILSVIRDGIFKLPAYVAWESIPGLFKSLEIPSLAGRYKNPIHTCFPAPVDCFEIPAQEETSGGILKFFKEPRNRFKGINSESLCSLAATTLLLFGS